MLLSLYNRCVAAIIYSYKWILRFLYNTLLRIFIHNPFNSDHARLSFYNILKMFFLIFFNKLTNSLIDYLSLWFTSLSFSIALFIRFIGSYIMSYKISLNTSHVISLIISRLY
jgi:hypothetical protein